MPRTFCNLDGLKPGHSVTGRLVNGRFVTGRFVTGRYVTGRLVGVPACHYSLMYLINVLCKN